MEIDLDRYYTPVHLAEELLTYEFQGQASVTVDSTCGTGNLLAAASNVYQETQCIGLDRDRKAIATLRRENPDWILSVGEILKDRSYKNTLAANAKARCDLLLLNPPFSQGNRKSVPITYDGSQLKSSIAMANILKSLELFRPKDGAMVIAPESILYSDLDAKARSCIEEKYHIEIIGELHDVTFSGARVRSTAIKILPGQKRKHPRRTVPSFTNKIRTKLVRGGMPVHQVKNSKARNAVLFLHSTDLKELVTAGQSPTIRTRQERKGRVAGQVVLLTRVGKPCIDNIQALTLPEEVQMSDCLFALCFGNKHRAVQAAERIRSNYASLLDIYRGTGARYVTLARLEEWLSEHGFIVGHDEPGET